MKLTLALCCGLASLSLVPRFCLGFCCLDGDGPFGYKAYASYDCDEDQQRIVYTNVSPRKETCLSKDDVAKRDPETFYTSDAMECCKAYFCLDGSKRVGSYCGEGCNVWGCFCTGCIQAPSGRRLTGLTGGNGTDTDTYTDTDTPLNRIAECQRLVVSRFNTHSLTTPSQVRAYYQCLSDNGDSVLDARDESYRQMLALLGSNSSDLLSLDGDGDGDIEGSEFDPLLAEFDDGDGDGDGDGAAGVSASLGNRLRWEGAVAVLAAHAARVAYVGGHHA
jgi:hypothetical protein